MSEEFERRRAQLAEGIEAFNRGDVDTVLALLDPDVETHVDPRLMNPGTHRGHEGYLEMVGAWTEAWGSLEAELLEVSEPDERHMLTEIRQRAVGAGSGVPVEMNIFWLFEFRERAWSCACTCTRIASLGARGAALNRVRAHARQHRGDRQGLPARLLRGRPREDPRVRERDRRREPRPSPP